MIEYLYLLDEAFLLLISFMHYSKNTVVEHWFTYFRLGSVMDFMYANYSWMFALSLTLMLTKWIKNWKVLIGIFIFVFCFMKFIWGL